jgi:tetratricopeptide (TPR) repeat protein
MSPEQTERPAHRFAEALAEYRAGAKEAALAFFERTARDHPDDAEALYYQGLILFKLGRHQEAVGPLRRSADLVPAEDALIKLAMAQGQTGNLEACLATLQEAVRKLPRSAPARAYLGTTLRTLDRLDEALEAYRAALELDPEHVPALWGLGVALGMAEQPAEGMAALRRAIQLDPAFPPPHFHLGVLAWVTGDLAEMRRQEVLLRGLATSYADRLQQITATKGSPHV